MGSIALFLSAAFFIFLAAAARTWIIPPDLRLVAAKGQIHHSAIDKGPHSGFFAEGRELVMLNSLIFLRVSRDKFDASLVIILFPAGYIEYLKAVPLRFFGPFAGILPVELCPGAGMDGSLDKVDVRCDMSGVPRAHQGLGRRRAAHAGKVRFTTLAK